MGLDRYGSDGVSALTEVFVAVCTPALESPHSEWSLGVCIVLYRPLVQRPLSTLTCTLIFCFYCLMCAYSDSCNVEAYFPRSSAQLSSCSYCVPLLQIFRNFCKTLFFSSFFLQLCTRKKATINVTEFGCGRTAGTGSRGWS